MPREATQPSRIVQWQGTKRRLDDDDDYDDRATINKASKKSVSVPNNRPETSSEPIFSRETIGRKGNRSKVEKHVPGEGASNHHLGNEDSQDWGSSGKPNLPTRTREKEKRPKTKSSEDSAKENEVPTPTTPQPKDSDRHRRQKSVSFTPDTKQEDGNTARRFSKDRIDPHEREEALVPSVEASDETEGDLTDKPEAVKKLPKREKKKEKKIPKEKKETAADSTNEEVAPYVTYLQLYHEDRTAWKFHKVRQSDLLKNVFNMRQVPARHDDAVVEYIAGLRGSAARERLRDSAKEILDGLNGEQTLMTFMCKP